VDYISYIRGIIKNIKYMNYSEKETIVVDGETYFHYSYGGKWNATKFIKIWGIHYYNSDIPFSFDTV
tara:strand:- start:915 stop:1115 length:201 start_codon:yes stop_codon:yes gene_type:complete